MSAWCVMLDTKGTGHYKRAEHKRARLIVTQKEEKIKERERENDTNLDHHGAKPFTSKSSHRLEQHDGVIPRDAPESRAR